MKKKLIIGILALLTLSASVIVFVKNTYNSPYILALQNIDALSQAEDGGGGGNNCWGNESSWYESSFCYTYVVLGFNDEYVCEDQSQYDYLRPCVIYAWVRGAHMSSCCVLKN